MSVLPRWHMPSHRAARKRQRSWTVRAHLIGILLFATVVSLVAAWLLASSSLDAARDRGRRNASFQAGLAARAIADALSQGQGVVAGLAGLDARALLADPSACTLSFAGLGVFPTGHLDLALPTGRVVCSSVVKQGAPPGATQAGAAWLTAAAGRSGPVTSAPFVDGLTQRTAVAITTPIVDRSGHVLLVAAMVLPLQPLAQGLADLYAGPQHFVFTVADTSGRQVLSPPPVAGAPTVPVANQSRWLQAGQAVPRLGWRVYAAERSSAALGPTRDTLRRGAVLGLGAFVLLLVLLGWLNRRIAGPIARLSRSVRHAANEVTPDPMLVRGPAEIRSLAHEFNTMIAIRAGHEEQLRRHTLRDPLTGAANRALLIDRLQRALLTTSTHAPILVATLDIDRFKAVNTNYGYPAGDAVLIATAQRLTARLADDDTLARLGGDEFVVVRSAPPQGDAGGDLDRLLHDVFSEPFPGPHEAIQVTASIGIAVADPTSTAEELLRTANLAMYAAKDGGGASTVLFTQALGAAASDRYALENELRGAQERGELSLEYQPIVNLVTNDVVGVEALLRWHHPDRGPIPPVAFIPLAETTGLIVPIGQFVLRQACQQAASWHQQGHRLRVSVNVSGHQLHDPRFTDQVATVLFETSLPADGLCLELTESTLMDDTQRTADALAALKSLGVRLSIDDFGTGYSSLAYLRRFPVDEVKVDRAFIQDLRGDDHDPALVAAMIAMGHALGLHVVAEGVEAQTQAHTLRTLGCRTAQGYLFSRPRPAEALTQLLERRRHADTGPPRPPT